MAASRRQYAVRLSSRDKCLLHHLLKITHYTASSLSQKWRWVGRFYPYFLGTSWRLTSPTHRKECVSFLCRRYQICHFTSRVLPADTSRDFWRCRASERPLEEYWNHIPASCMICTALNGWSFRVLTGLTSSLQRLLAATLTEENMLQPPLITRLNHSHEVQ